MFSRHPLETTMPSLSRDYITVSVQAKIHQLQKFLAIKLGVPDWSAFQAPRDRPRTACRRPFGRRVRLVGRH